MGFCCPSSRHEDPLPYNTCGAAVRCDFCREMVPDRSHHHAFFIYGRGKHDGKWMCDWCLASRSGR